jgi:hypothetical protein
MRRTDFIQVAAPVVAIASISALYYAIQDQLVWMHNILQHLYFAPIAATAIYFGWKGGMGTAMLAALCYAPHLVMGLSAGTEPRRFPLALNQEQGRSCFGFLVRPDADIDAAVLHARPQVDLVSLSPEELCGEALEIPPVHLAHVLAVLGKVVDVPLV